MTADMDQRLLDSGCIDGKNVGVPLSTSILCMGYNPQVLESFGLELPDGTWTWPKFLENASAVSASLQKPGVLTSAGITKDTNIFRYWVRQHGEELFNEDGTALGFEDISLTEEFFSMWKDMMDADISPDPDEMAQIISLGQDKGPLVTEDAAYIFEWDNYAVKMSGVNDSLRITLPPLVDGYDHKGLWMKPGMFFSVAQTSKVKDACARFIDWFINSREANDIIMAERGTPVSSKIREYMVQTGRMSAQQIEMFEYVDKASAYCGETPKPDPIGITQVNELFNNAGNRVFYGTASAREAAEDFHTQANAILEKYN